MLQARFLVNITAGPSKLQHEEPPRNPPWGFPKRVAQKVGISVFSLLGASKALEKLGAIFILRKGKGVGGWYS